MFHKGDRVWVHATAFTSTGTYVDQIIHCPPDKTRYPTKKRLYRRPIRVAPLKGLLIGRTYRATGWYDEGYTGAWGFEEADDIEPPSLLEDKRHTLWLVEPADPGDDRYYKPFTALEQDLEAVHG